MANTVLDWEYFGWKKQAKISSVSTDYTCSAKRQTINIKLRKWHTPRQDGEDKRHGEKKQEKGNQKCWHSIILNRVFREGSPRNWHLDKELKRLGRKHVVQKLLMNCNNMIGPWGHFAKWDKSDKEIQIPNDLNSVWNLKIKTKQTKKSHREQTGC